MLQSLPSNEVAKFGNWPNARRPCARRETCAHILNAHMRAKKTRAANPMKLPRKCTILHHKAILPNYSDKACKAIKIAIVGFQAWKLRAHVRAHTGRAAIPARMSCRQIAESCTATKL